MAASSRDREFSLDTTSEWIVTHTGYSRSQFYDTATKQLVTNLCDVISYYDTHLENSPSCEVLYEVQELCVSIANHPETFPLIEALLLHCHKERWEFPDCTSNDTYPMTPRSSLSKQFLQTVTQLMNADNPIRLVLSYESQVALWSSYTPALHQELSSMAEMCMRYSSDKAILRYFNDCNIVRACAEHPKLFEASTHFLSEMVEREQDRSRVLYLFNQSVTSYKSV